MKTIFKVSTNANLGDNWPIASLGQDIDGIDYWVTTDHVHASELYQYSGGPKVDAELIVRLLNEHFIRLIENG